jgi:4'-phosphopantetheinyl transferase
MNRDFIPASANTDSTFVVPLIWADLQNQHCNMAAAIDSGAGHENDLAVFLSDDERRKANQIADASERRHFMFRRGFQRVFVCRALRWKGALNDIIIKHQRDVQPRCMNAPECELSFSSSGNVVVAGLSHGMPFGIDIENIRPIAEVVAVARRFFTANEARLIADLPDSRQGEAFLQHWTAKEAGLKATGKGIVSGLNSFVLAPSKRGYLIHMQGETAAASAWRLQFTTFVEGHIVAVVHRPVDKQNPH